MLHPAPTIQRIATGADEWYLQQIGFLALQQGYLAHHQFLRQTFSFCVCTTLFSGLAFIKAKGGLDAVVTPDFLSHGQRQLFCRARALIRQSQIVVLDEVSANGDIQTDELMQQIIREQLDRCTGWQS